MLDKALNREAALRRLEELEKEARKREIVELQSHYSQGQKDKAAYEKMVDDLVAQENAKQWESREQQWRREDQARINLLKNVYANREADILLKQALKKEEQWLIDHEKAGIDAEIERQNQLHEEKQLNAAVARKAHQTDILKQVSERERAMRRDLQEKMYEERAAKLAELEYSRRIQAEK